MKMSPELEQDLRELKEAAEELATAGSRMGDMQPRCIARAFARNQASALVLTMQGWIDLDAVTSPILTDDELDEEESITQVIEAVAAFNYAPFDPTLAEPEEVVALVLRMRAAVRMAFSTCLRMKLPGDNDESREHGFGTWLPLLACLIVQCKLSLAEALAIPVVQAYALVAAMRLNQGYIAAGQPYAARTVEP